MNRFFLKASILIFLLLLIASCQTNSTDDELNGRITLWHGWSAEETSVLEGTLDEFQEINPDVSVVSVALPPEELLAQFEQAAADGLGPDLLLGSSDWIADLADAGLIRPLGEDDISDRQYRTTASAISGYHDAIYGLPLSVFPLALYYNKLMIDQPAEDLEELLSQAADGKRVAFVPRFQESYWGIQAHGEGLFDEEGNFTPVDSGFAEWLDWLNEAQNEPGVILNVDKEGLLDLFAREQIAYYVGGPEMLASLKETMGADKFGITTLPEGPLGPSGPLLPDEAILFYANSSPEQIRLANALAGFLTGPQQSIRFMRFLNRVPANPSVEVDSRLYPLISGFSRQAKDGIILPKQLNKTRFYAAGDRAIAGVLSGTITPEEALCRFGLSVADFQDYNDSEISLNEGCNADSMP
jgi:arabinogalactan oligomer/maltooligosaccharide transport system substrate-binding protein